MSWDSSSHLSEVLWRVCGEVVEANRQTPAGLRKPFPGVRATAVSHMLVHVCRANLHNAGRKEIRGGREKWSEDKSSPQ